MGGSNSSMKKFGPTTEEKIKQLVHKHNALKPKSTAFAFPETKKRKSVRSPLIKAENDS